MIESFKDKDTKKIWEEVYSKDINDLRVPPGNRKGQYSIRINDQWRICFFWKNGAASEVEIADYH